METESTAARIRRGEEGLEHRTQKGGSGQFGKGSEILQELDGGWKHRGRFKGAPKRAQKVKLNVRDIR